ncbi:MAG: hypothetical protein JSS02_25205 [Planctomycetes bacterium]|nr:hypothetical protein [Planctomycetota bacterium]
MKTALRRIAAVVVPTVLIVVALIWTMGEFPSLRISGAVVSPVSPAPADNPAPLVQSLGTSSALGQPHSQNFGPVGSAAPTQQNSTKAGPVAEELVDDLEPEPPDLSARGSSSPLGSPTPGAGPGQTPGMGSSSGMRLAQPPAGTMSGIGAAVGGGGPPAPGMMGMGGMPGMSGPALPAANFVQGKNAALLINEVGDKLWGYSVPLGKWSGLSISKTDKRPVPTLGHDVGIFTTDDRIYAFSSQTGRWDTLATKGRKSAAVHGDLVVLMDGEKVHIFSNTTGRWSSADDPADDTDPASHRPVPSRAETTDSALPYPLTDLKGRLIVRGDVSTGGDLDLYIAETSERVNAAELLDSLKSRSLAAERDAVQRALEVRSGAPIPETAAALKARLEQAVRDAFDCRQQAQRLEAEILRVKLQRVEQRLAERDKAKSAILSRRVDELMNGKNPFGTAPNGARPGASREPPSLPPSGDREMGAGSVEKTPRGQSNSGEPEVKTSEAAPTGDNDVVSQAFARTLGLLQRNSRRRPLPPFQARSRTLETVGVITSVDAADLITITLHQTELPIGQELVVSRLDFVHEDGTEQYYTYARLIVVGAGPGVVFGRLLALNRDEAGHPFDSGRPEQRVSRELYPRKHAVPQADDLLSNLQGEWRMDKWVKSDRVRPPGDLKGNRHRLIFNEDWMTLIDAAEMQVLERIQFVKPNPQVSRGTPQEVASYVLARSRNATVEITSGAFALHDSTLRMSFFEQAVGEEATKLEPGPGLNYMEFTRAGAPPQKGTPAGAPPGAKSAVGSAPDVRTLDAGGGDAGGIPDSRGPGAPPEPPTVNSRTRPESAPKTARVSPGRNRPQSAPPFKARAAETRNVGQVSGRGPNGEVLIAAESTADLHLGDELVVSRVDFVHEDGRQQFYRFARLFVVQTPPESPVVARIVEINLVRDEANNLVRDGYKWLEETVEAGQFVGLEVFEGQLALRGAASALTAVQGRWRMDRRVEDDRVLPAGDLKGSRHLLVVNGDWFTLLDPSGGLILKRFQIRVGHPQFSPQPEGVIFSLQTPEQYSGPPGILRQTEAKLQIAWQTGQKWNIELEPGPDRTYWEFTRDSAPEGSATEPSRSD